MSIVSIVNANADLQLERMPSTGTPYTLLLPHQLDNVTPAPLIVALHYGGYSGEHYGRHIVEQLVAPAYESLGAIIVAPDCAQGAWGEPVCEANVLELIEYLKGRYAIDSRRIVIVGYSLGGIGTWVMAKRHAELFSAAIVMAGRPPEVTLNTQWETPVYVIHGSNDELMPVAQTQKFVDALLATGAQVALEILNDVSHYETHRFVAPLRSSVSWLIDVWAKAR